MSLPDTIPLPTTSGIENTEIGGFSLVPPPPDRYSDHIASDTERFMVLQWIDNKKKKSKEVWVSLGKTGPHEMIRWRPSMGTYRSRQFRIIFSDACHFELVGLEDEVKVLK